MRRLARALGALALTLAAGGATALAPAAAEAQGGGRKSWQDNDKAHRKQDRARHREARRPDARFRDDDRRRDDRRRFPPGRRVATTGSPRAWHVPPGHLPPPGLCRIWYDGVPPGRQPRPTSCAQAERYRPANARVLYGPRTAQRFDRRRDVDHRRDERRRDDRRRDDRRRDDGRWDARSRIPEGAIPRRPLPLP